MSVTGLVSSIYVRENDDVTIGQLLLRLDQSGYLADVDRDEAAVRRAEASVERATLLLEQLPEDATPAQVEVAETELRLAQADLELAEATLAEAEAALRQTELRAPIAGTVASVDVTPGELAFAGTPILTIADMSSWLIETTDVSELEVVRVAVGDLATVTFAALPDTVLTGRVERIQVRGTSGAGQVQFAVVIRPDVHLPALRWNMSATVSIEPSG
jgi:RND family efflux transporter MFP subunit